VSTFVDTFGPLQSGGKYQETTATTLIKYTRNRFGCTIQYALGIRRKRNGRSKEWSEAMKIVFILLLLGFGFVCVLNTHYLLSKIALTGVFLLVGAAYVFLSRRAFFSRDKRDEE
jgi:hypothetical protein